LTLSLDNRVFVPVANSATDKTLKAGKARAVFSVMDDNRLAFDLDWEWINGDHSWGQSRYEEVVEKDLMK